MDLNAFDAFVDQIKTAMALSILLVFILAAASFAGRPKSMRSPVTAFDAAPPHPSMHNADLGRPKVI